MKQTRKCSICPEKHHAKGYCNGHYMQWYIYGDPLVVKRIKSLITEPVAQTRTERRDANRRAVEATQLG